jgi:hypothetical protein
MVAEGISKEVLASNSRVGAFNEVASMKALTQTWTLPYLRVTFSLETSILAHILNLEHVAVLDPYHKDPMEHLVLDPLDRRPRVSRVPRHV